MVKEDNDSVHFRNRDRSDRTKSSSEEEGSLKSSNSSNLNGYTSHTSSANSSSKHSKSNLNNSTSSRARTTIKMKRPMSVTRKVLYLAIFLLCGYYTLTWFVGDSGHSHNVNWIDTNIRIKLGLQTEAYAVVIDAGSTGSRVLAFAFYQSSGSEKSLKLKDELFVETKPGLSSFAEDPVQGAKTIEKLLDDAKTFIPEDKWASTPISLKATAGLRLLPKDKADKILFEVAKVISESGFLSNEQSVGIMDGTDEGIFSWFTVNFLLDRIGGPVSKTVAALDLGGGSTQITTVSTSETFHLYPKEDIQNITLYHQSVPLYTHSYLGLGLQSFRKAVLSYNQSADAKVLTSPCVNPIVSRDWTHGGQTFTIKGTKNSKFREVKYEGGFKRKEPVADWDECHDIIIKLIEEKKIVKSKDLNRQVVIFSYFFERAAEAGLIDPLEGGKITIQHFLDSGKIACKTTNTELPLLCLDVTFMGALLHNGYGINTHTPLLALKKIHGHEISWALGLAYHVLQNGL